MFRLISAAALALSMTTAASYAADLAPTTVDPSAPVMLPFSWTGFYVGASAGYSFANGQDASTVGTAAFVALGPTIVPSSLDQSGSGFIGGGFVGYNAQFGAFVVGAEADLSYVNQSKEDSFSGAPIGGGIAPAGITTFSRTSLDSFGSLRARLGFTPFDRSLIYATGGLAFGGVSNSTSVYSNSDPLVNWRGESTDTKVGWTLGAGFEYAFTNNVTARIEYLYYDLGTVSTSASPSAAAAAAAPGVAYDSDVDVKGSIVRAGIAYKF